MYLRKAKAVKASSNWDSFESNPSTGDEAPSVSPYIPSASLSGLPRLDFLSSLEPERTIRQKDPFSLSKIIAERSTFSARLAGVCETELEPSLVDELRICVKGKHFEAMVRGILRELKRTN